jgi:hypothetical protein
MDINSKRRAEPISSEQSVRALDYIGIAFPMLLSAGLEWYFIGLVGYSIRLINLSESNVKVASSV